MKKTVYISLCLTLIFFTFSCKKKTEPIALDFGYDYAPINIGKYVIYDVDSTVYDDFKKDTTYYKYRIKEKLEDVYFDNEGRSAIKLVRYIKKYNPLVNYDNLPWVIKDVWNYTRTKTSLEVVEENIRFVKLIFPIKSKDEWNGNAFNTIGEWKYKCEYSNAPQTIGGKFFSNVLSVLQRTDKNNAIHREYYIEKYAKDIGLVYREIKDLYSNGVKVDAGGIVPVEKRIEKGVIYKLTYQSHGNE